MQKINNLLWVPKLTDDVNKIIELSSREHQKWLKYMYYHCKEQIVNYKMESILYSPNYANSFMLTNMYFIVFEHLYKRNKICNANLIRSLYKHFYNVNHKNIYIKHCELGINLDTISYDEEEIEFHDVEATNYFEFYAFQKLIFDLKIITKENFIFFFSAVSDPSLNFKNKTKEILNSYRSYNPIKYGEVNEFIKLIDSLSF